MISYDTCSSVSSLNMLTSRSIHVDEMALFHLLWLIFHCIFYDMWTLDSGLRDVTDDLFA